MLRRWIAVQRSTYCTASYHGNDDEYTLPVHENASLRKRKHSIQLGKFSLESGDAIDQLEVAYTSYGTLSREKDNAVVVCHAFTGNSQVDTWWKSLLGPGCALDTNKYFIVCANILGSCYGTTGPCSINLKTNKPYGLDFPKVTVRDTVRAHADVVFHALGIPKLQCVIGGSLGGMQALEWACFGKDKVNSIIAMACGGSHSAWQIGISELQRRAIMLDPKYKHGDVHDPPLMGLSLARQIAMVSYRTHEAYHKRYGRDITDDCFAVQSYLAYQGNKIKTRFDPFTYLTLMHLMDSHDISRHRASSISESLSRIHVPATIVGIDSDVLYPIAEQIFLAKHLPHAELHTITSTYGHDGFLLEQNQLDRIIRNVLI